MWNVLGKVITADGVHAAEAQAAPLVGMLPQLLAVLLGVNVKSADVLEWPLIILTVERQEDKHALLRKPEITVMDFKILLLADNKRYFCLTVERDKMAETKTALLKQRSSLVIDRIIERADRLIVVSSTHKTAADLMESFPDFQFVEKQLAARRCAFPITPEQFTARDGESVIRGFLSLLQSDEIAVVETRVLPPTENNLPDSTVVEIGVLEDDVTSLERIPQLLQLDFPATGVRSSAPTSSAPTDTAASTRLADVHKDFNAGAEAKCSSQDSPDQTMQSYQSINKNMHSGNNVTGAAAATSTAGNALSVMDMSAVAMQQTRNAYLFWDIENCSLQRSDDAVQVLRNVEAVMQHVAGYGWTPSGKDMALARYVFINRGTANSPHVTNTQIKDLEDSQCAFINYSSKGSADFMLMAEVDKVIRQNRSNSAGGGALPLICLVTGDRDFSSTLEKLRAEGYHDTILLHKDVARASFLQHASSALKWSTVRTLHTLPNRLDVLPVPAHFRHFVEAQLRTVSSFPLDDLAALEFPSQSLTPVAYGYSSLVDVLSRLTDLGWVVNERSGLSFMRIVQSRVYVKRHAHTRYLMQYEVPRLVTTVPDGGVRAVTDIDIFQESKSSSFETSHALVVCSCSVSKAEEAADYLKQRLTSLKANTQTVMLPGWTKHFGDAFVSSRVLNECELQAQTALVVHFKGTDSSNQYDGAGGSGGGGGGASANSQVSVEVAAADATIVAAGIKLLRLLRPVVRVLEISDLDFKAVNVSLAHELHSTYGVKLFQSRNRRVEVYGFEPYVDAAMSQLSDFLSSLSVESPLILAKKAPWLYMVQFQNVFRAYLQDAFNVELVSRRKGEGPVEDTRSDDGVRSGGTMHLRGTREQVEAAGNYINSITSNLRTIHLEFRGCGSFKYKTLFDHQKRLHTRLLEGNIALRDEDNMVMDPTRSDCPPLVFISLSPPLHKQGIQHMDFPVDVKVDAWCHGNHKSALDEVAQSFNRVDHTFTYHEETFHGDFSPVLRHLMDKSWRTTLIEDTKISGILWEQDRQIVKVWGEDGTSVQRAVSRLRDLVTSPAGTEAKQVLRWPDPVLRYVLLPERNRKPLLDAVDALKDKHSLQLEMPYRDKKDPMACMLVTGRPADVDDAQNRLNEVVRTLLDSLRRVFAVISPHQYDVLTADGFRLVKSVQRVYGVYVNLQPPEDLKLLKHRETLGGVDLRIARSGEVKTDENSVFCTATIEARGTLTRTLRVLCQELSEASADAIVIPNDSRLQTRTNVAKSVLAAAAGLDPHAQLPVEVFYNMACLAQMRGAAGGAEIEIGSTFVTSGTQLKYAAHLLHVIVPNQNPNQPALLTSLHGCLRAVLQHATELGLQSIALPLLKLYGPTTDPHIIRLTIMTVMQYLTENPGSSLRRVDIVSFLPESCAEVQHELQLLAEQESTWHVEQDDHTFAPIAKNAAEEIEQLYIRHATSAYEHADVCIGSVRFEDGVTRNVLVTSRGVYQENPETERRRRLCRGGLASFPVFPQLMGPTMIPHFDVSVRQQRIENDYHLQDLDTLISQKPENAKVIVLEGFPHSLEDAVLAVARAVRDEAMTTMWLPVLTDAPTSVIVDGLRPTARLLDVQLEARYRRVDAAQPMTQSYGNHMAAMPVATDMGILVTGLRGLERDIARDLRIKVVEEATKWKKTATLPPEDWCNDLLQEIMRVQQNDGVIPADPPQTLMARQVRHFLELVPQPDRVRSSPEELLLSVIHSWVNAEQEPSYEIVEVAPTSEEFMKVISRVGLQDLLSSHDNVRLDRIMNMKLWSQYANKRLHILQQPHNRGKAESSDRLLLHGTSDTNPDLLFANGFDFRFSKGRGLWGRGMYFSSDLEYVKTFAYRSTSAKKGERQLLIAYVCLGRSALMDKDRNLVKPPAGYDSVTGQVGGSPIFVTYDLDRAYPAYLLTFTEKRISTSHALSAREAK